MTLLGWTKDWFEIIFVGSRELKGKERKHVVFLTCNWRGLQVWPFGFVIENIFRKAQEYLCCGVAGEKGGGGSFWEEQGFVLPFAAGWLRKNNSILKSDS